MGWIPGWDSAATAGWWSGFYFWLSITALMSLGVFEVISHRYGERKDELAEIEQENVQRRHDAEMAAIHERAAKLEKEAAQAKLELARFRQPRVQLLNDSALRLIAERLKLFAGTKFDTGLAANSGEQADFLWLLEPALMGGESGRPGAGWVGVGWGNLRRGDRPLSGSVAAQNVEIHLHPESRAKLRPAAEALISVLNELGIVARDAGFNSHSPNVDALHLQIGEKQ